MSCLDFLNTPLTGLMVIQRKPIEDTRGFLSRLYSAEEFTYAGIDKPISQINHTLTLLKGAVRGLHYQKPPYSEAKVVNCLKGEVFDVAVDLRRGSSTFLRWYGEKLSAQNNRGLLIPEGFAHGFQALSENCELIYFHTAPYVHEAEAGLNVVDTVLGINWPLPITELSDRDRSHPMVHPDFQGVSL
ncbi:MAG: dTDP-4-dehydrorhamnose 3,5-epimerase [Proteobacteria bacterium]|nr:dTDP-4-dehydrorhamnose 3,5-epimerase [Pseudomonadota bacterium]